MTETDQEDAAVDALLAELAADRTEPSSALLARVMEDAETVQESFLAAPVPPKPVSLGFGARIMALIGGVPGAASLASAIVAGVWLGYSPPAAIDGLATSFLGPEDLLAVDVDDFVSLDAFLLDG